MRTIAAESADVIDAVDPLPNLRLRGRRRHIAWTARLRSTLSLSKLGRGRRQV